MSSWLRAWKLHALALATSGAPPRQAPDHGAFLLSIALRPLGLLCLCFFADGVPYLLALLRWVSIMYHFVRIGVRSLSSNSCVLSPHFSYFCHDALYAVTQIQTIW
jgi:hypothetical protein